METKKMNTNKEKIKSVISKRKDLFIGIAAIVAIIFVALIVLNSMQVNFNKVAEEYIDESFCDVSSDGSYLYIDTNPKDEEDEVVGEAIYAIKNINKDLNIPESVLKRMMNTRAIDGTQSYSGNGIDITWTYYPDSGLEVTYSRA